VPHVFNVPETQVPELQLATMLVGVNLLIAFPTSALSAIFEARHRFDIMSGVTIVSRVIAAVATVVMLELGYGILSLVVIDIAGTVIAAVLLLLFLARLMPEVRLGLGPVRGAHLRE